MTLFAHHWPLWGQTIETCGLFSSRAAALDMALRELTRMRLSHCTVYPIEQGQLVGRGTIVFTLKERGVA